MPDYSESSFIKIFDLYWEPMFGVAFKMVKSKDQAKDVVQQVFIDFWEKRRMSEVLNIEHYLIRATKFASLKHLRDNKTNNFLQIELADNLSVNSSDNYDNNILNQQLETAIDELPPKCKEIFLLSRMHQLSNKQISEKLNLSQRTVETQISKALKHLKNKLNYKGLIALLINFL